MTEAFVAVEDRPRMWHPHDEGRDTVNHDESIEIILRGIADGRVGARPSTEERQQAEEHVAQCSDCWEVLSSFYTLATGEHPAESERMRTLYGCERVQDQLWLLEGL